MSENEVGLSENSKLTVVNFICKKMGMPEFRDYETFIGSNKLIRGTVAQNLENIVNDANLGMEVKEETE